MHIPSTKDITPFWNWILRKSEYVLPSPTLGIKALQGAPHFFIRTPISSSFSSTLYPFTSYTQQPPCNSNSPSSPLLLPPSPLPPPPLGPAHAPLAPFSAATPSSTPPTPVLLVFSAFSGLFSRTQTFPSVSNALLSLLLELAAPGKSCTLNAQKSYIVLTFTSSSSSSQAVCCENNSHGKRYSLLLPFQLAGILTSPFSRRTRLDRLCPCHALSTYMVLSKRTGPDCMFLGCSGTRCLYTTHPPS